MESGRISGFGNRILFIGAHPDDIEIGCGGAAAKFSGEGRAIAFAIASINPLNGSEREVEATQAACKLGLSEAAGNLFFGRISETSFVSEKNQLRTWLKDVSSKFKPDTIFTHRRDGHDHHCLVSEVSSGCFLTQCYYEYFIPRTEPEPPFSPTAFIDIEDHIDRKVAMCACHVTQKGKYISEDSIRSTAHVFYNRCDALQAHGKTGYVEAFNSIRVFTLVGTPLAAMDTTSSNGSATRAVQIPGRPSPRLRESIFVKVSRVLRTMKAEQFVGQFRRRAALSYLTYLHEDVVHEMRKFALACEYCGASDEWNDGSWEVFGPAARDFCSACRKMFCDLAELDGNQIHCCLKLVDGSESVVTWARSEPADYRDETLLHPIDKNTVWCSLLGRNDGKRTWQLFNCFSSGDLLKHQEQFCNSRQDWKTHYRSALVFPLRYANRRGTTNFDTFGFLALDSKKLDAFVGMPEIFEHIGDRDVYHDRARKCVMFQAGAAIADTLSMFLRPIFIRNTQK